jgi:hypothetical protein
VVGDRALESAFVLLPGVAPAVEPPDDVVRVSEDPRPVLPKPAGLLSRDAVPVTEAKAEAPEEVGITVGVEPVMTPPVFACENYYAKQM